MAEGFYLTSPAGEKRQRETGRENREKYFKISEEGLRKKKESRIMSPLENGF